MSSGQLDRSGITDLVGQDAFYASVVATITDYRQKSELRAEDRIKYGKAAAKPLSFCVAFE